MPVGVITAIEQVSTGWLTSVLSRSEALRQGKVDDFEASADRGNWSESVHLKLRYKPGSQGKQPERLFLKMVNTDLEDEFFGASEVNYYTRDYIDVPDAPLLKCYDGAYSERQRRYHLLLEDVSHSHVEAAQKEPDLAYGEALAEGLAALHARWWGARRLADAGAPVHSPAHIRRFVEIAEPGLEHILGSFTSDLKPHWPGLLRELFAKHPDVMIARSRDANGFTLIHGDAGHNNILVPVDGVKPLYLIDRQPFDWSLTTWLGAYDLAYAIVLDWEIDTRRELEMSVLQHYHYALIRRGVSDYPWERLYDDYRLCAAMGVYIAVEYCRGGINQRWLDTWLPMLQRALTACDDLKCSELW